MKLKEQTKNDFKQYLIFIIVTFVILKCIAMPIKVSGSSMYPTYKNEDFCFSSVIGRYLTIDRFDVVVVKFADSNKNPNGKNIVKRVIGLPGETIEYINSDLYINGEKQKEDFLSTFIKTNDFSIILGENEYFILGDNREASKDSRYYGPCAKEEIKAVHMLKIFNLEKLGIK